MVKTVPVNNRSGIKTGINPLLENVSYKESPDLESKDLKLKEMLEEDERDSKTILRETGETLKSIQQCIIDDTIKYGNGRERFSNCT